MAEATGRRRDWADVAAILVGVALLAVAIWPGGITADVDAQRQIRFLDAAWLIYAIAGAVALAGVVAAQWRRNRVLGRALLALAGIALLVGLVLFRDLGWRAWITFLLPGLVLLAASASAGPLSRPD